MSTKGRRWRGGRQVDLVDDREDWSFGNGWKTEAFRGHGREVKGESQEFLGVDELDRLDSAGVIVGADKRVYEKKHGLIECLVPVKLDPDEAKVYVESVEWEYIPPPGELAWLLENFFGCYDREVLMLVGKKRDKSGWLYHVPEQVGTGGSIDWEADDEEMGQFADQAEWVGTIHVHPGDGCSPSQTDVDDWAEPEKSGLHIILGRGRSYTVSGAIAGKTISLHEGNLTGIEPVPVEYSTSRGRGLGELLKEPKKVRFQEFKVACSPSDRVMTEDVRDEVFSLPMENAEYVGDALETIGSLKVGRNQLGCLGYLRVVSHRGECYILTPEQWEELGMWCEDVCDMPRARRLRVKRTTARGV